MIAGDVPEPRLPPITPEESGVVVTAVPTPTMGSPLLARLLQIAHLYRSKQSLRQAIEMYFELLEGHPRSLEAQAAHQALLEIGEEYERNGGLRQAQSLYERLF